MRMSDIILNPCKYSGTVTAPVSKSHVHRLLICAAFSDKETVINLGCESELSKDIGATISCLSSLGADISHERDRITVILVKSVRQNAEMMCGESGSTLRFMLPVTAALGVNAQFHMLGRLSERPLSPLYEEMTSHGCTMSEAGANPLLLEGKMSGGTFTVSGDVSSQYISGLLFALPLTGCGGEIIITGNRESQAYIDMTVDAMRKFGVNVIETDSGYSVGSGERYKSPAEISAEGDWSNGAFWLSLGALSESAITCENLNPDSIQGDKKIIELLKAFGADINVCGNSVTVKRNKLKAPNFKISVSEIPDLVPILSVIAAVSDGETEIVNAGRLRIKECDRLSAVTDMIKNLGGDITEGSDSLTIRGKSSLSSGTVNGYNDHRIVMSAAIASAVCTGDVTITDSEAVKKSYPSFFDELKKLRRR